YQLGFGINRTNNFNNRILIEGYNGTNSINDTWIDNANGIYFGDIETDSYGYYAYDLNPAWWTYLLDTIPGTVDQYYGPVLNAPGQEILQREESTTWGSMNEFLFSFGGNFGDRLYLGGTFGFPMIRYFRETRYSEIDENNVLNDFNSLQLFERLQTRASGFNMKFGMIVRATDWLRIGGAIHSPTWYSNMQDEWYSELSSSFDNGDRYSERSPVGYYDYKLETPWRAMGSLGFIIAKTALLDLDYEFVDYASSRLRGSDYGFNDENRVIRDNYSETHNFRAGAEYRIGHFALRGGGGYSASPFKNDLNDGEKIYYSGGFGYRDKDFFVDFAWVRSQMNQNYYLYGSENVSVEPADNKFVTNNFMVTFGVRY
ncbi:MAG: hypothetical protein KDC05_06075, partial [Bacteroidales bacterium]|nr:hypothetical protein [Bacteroidales bacterium]